MTACIEIRNPSHYERSGYATLEWDPVREKTGIPDSDLTLLDAANRSVPFQIDRVTPQDPSHDVLVLHIPKALPPGDEHYKSHPGAILTIGRKSGGASGGRPAEARDSSVSVRPDAILKINENQGPGRFELINSRLLISFGLHPFSDSKNRDANWWYSGSTTSARIKDKEWDYAHNVEMLDIWRRWEIHEPDKRCMQIDRIHVGRQPWGGGLRQPHQEFPLFDRPYALVSQYAGPFRASLTVASEPFDYVYYDSEEKEWCHLDCQLYRIISLYPHADYVVEDLFVEGRPKDPACGKKQLLDFSPHYFACMDMGPTPCVYQFPSIPDWFAVGWPHGRGLDHHPGYGFACDVHLDAALSHPHPDYPFPETSHKTFSWRLQASHKATCLHLFMRGAPAGFDERTGHHWYEVLYKPLQAKFAWRNDR